MKITKGFTLVEVLVAVVILAIGLLGLASMEATGLNYNQSAYSRSQATQLAYDIADRIRSNPLAVANYLAGSPKTCPNGTNPCTACTTAGTACNRATMAQKDLYEWNQNMTAVLPAANNVICIDSTPADGTPANPACDLIGNVYTVKIWWQDDKSPAAELLRFHMSFRL